MRSGTKPIKRKGDTYIPVVAHPVRTLKKLQANLTRKYGTKTA